MRDHPERRRPSAAPPARSILGLVAVGGLVLLLGLGAGALIARQIARPLRPARRRRRARSARATSARPRAGRGLGRAAGPRAHVQRDGRAARAARREPARVRRRRLAPAPHAAGRAAAAARGGAARPATREEIEAALKEVDRLSAMVSELLLLSQAGEVDAPAEEIDLGAAARGGRGALRRARQRPLRRAHAARALRPRRPRAHARHAGRERAPLRRRHGHARRPPRRDRRARRRPGRRPGRSSRRSSSASTAARPAAPGRPAPASACRSPAS